MGGISAKQRRLGFNGLGAHNAGIISQLPDFEKFKKMLDLGGGPGIMSLYLIQAHSSMIRQVFGQPVVAEVARDFIILRALKSGGDFICLQEGPPMKTPSRTSCWGTSPLNKQYCENGSVHRVSASAITHY